MSQLDLKIGPKIKAFRRQLGLQANKLAEELNNNWHQLKGRWERRSAELLSSALVQLLSQGDRSEVQALTEQALGWINGALKDPGCPHH